MKNFANVCSYTVIRFVSCSAKFGSVVGLNGTLVEAKKRAPGTLDVSILGC